MLEHEDDPVQIELDEFYYSHHAGLWFNLKLLCRTQKYVPIRLTSKPGRFLC